MKNRILALLLAGMCLTPSISQADSIYVSGNIGGSDPHDSNYVNGSTVIYKHAISYDESLIYGAAVGLQADDYRLEIAYGHQKNDVKKILGQTPSGSGNNASISSYMANIYFDKDHDAKIDPYIMLGLGLATIDASGPNMIFPAKSSVFAWQIGLGAGFRATKHIVVDAGLRYFKPSSYTVSGVKITSASTNLLMGLQYYF